MHRQSLLLNNRITATFYSRPTQCFSTLSLNSLVGSLSRIKPSNSECLLDLYPSPAASRPIVVHRNGPLSSKGVSIVKYQQGSRINSNFIDLRRRLIHTSEESGACGSSASSLAPESKTTEQIKSTTPFSSPPSDSQVLPPSVPLGLDFSSFSNPLPEVYFLDGKPCSRQEHLERCSEVILSGLEALNYYKTSKSSAGEITAVPCPDLTPKLPYQLKRKIDRLSRFGVSLPTSPARRWSSSLAAMSASSSSTDLGGREEDQETVVKPQRADRRIRPTIRLPEPKSDAQAALQSTIAEEESGAASKTVEKSLASILRGDSSSAVPKSPRKSVGKSASQTPATPPPPDVIIDKHKSGLVDYRRFITDYTQVNKPTIRKKDEYFAFILQLFKLPPDSEYVTLSDISRSHINLQHTKFSVQLDEPQSSSHSEVPPVSDSLYLDVAGVLQSTRHDVLSTFASINNETAAKAALAFLTRPAIKFLPEESEGSQSSLSVSSFQSIPSRSPPSGVVGVSLETTGNDCFVDELRLLALSFPESPTLLFDVRQLWGSDQTNSDNRSEAQTEVTEDTKRKLKEAIQNVFSDNKLIKVVYNGKQVIKFLNERLGLKLEGPLSDLDLLTSLLQAGTRDAEKTRSLQEIAKASLDIDVLPAGLGGNSKWAVDNLTSDHLVRASRHSAVLLPLHQALTAEAVDGGLQDVVEIENRCVLAVAQMETIGLRVKEGAFEKLAKDVMAEVISGEYALRSSLGVEGQEKVNVNSPAQVLKLLQEKNCTVRETVRRNTSGELCIEEETAWVGQESLCGNSPSSHSSAAPKSLLASEWTEVESLIMGTHAMTLKKVVNNKSSIEPLLSHRKTKRALTAFIDKLPSWIHPVTGRIHPNLNQCGTASGRFSCVSPNLQGIPRGKQFRSCFIPATPGNLFVIADFSQIELRIAADLSEDPLMIRAFQEKKDLHTLTASLITGRAPEDIQKSDRQLAKAINFGLIYGIGPKGLQDYAHAGYNVTMTIEEATRFRDLFFQAYAGIKTWHTMTGRKNVQFCGNIQFQETRTRSNRRAIFKGSGRFQQLINYPVQGTSADITKEGLNMLYDRLPAVEGKLVMCVHDEILVEIPKESADAALPLVINTLEEAGGKYLRHVECVVDGAVGADWSHKP